MENKGIERFRKLVEQNKLEKALQLAVIQYEKSDINSDLLVLNGRLKRLRQGIRNDTLSSEYISMEYNKITFSFLDLLDVQSGEDLPEKRILEFRNAISNICNNPELEKIIKRNIPHFGNEYAQVLKENAYEVVTKPIYDELREQRIDRDKFKNFPNHVNGKIRAWLNSEEGADSFRGMKEKITIPVNQWIALEMDFLRKSFNLPEARLEVDLELMDEFFEMDDGIVGVGLGIWNALDVFMLPLMEWGISSMPEQWFTKLLKFEKGLSKKVTSAVQSLGPVTLTKKGTTSMVDYIKDDIRTKIWLGSKSMEFEI